MSRPEDQWRPPEPPNRQQPPRPNGQRPSSRPRWMPWIIVAVLVTLVLVWQAAPGGGGSQASVDYSKFLSLVKADHVDQINYESSSGKITGQFKGDFQVDGQSKFTTQGQPDGLPDQDVATLTAHDVGRNYKPAPSNWLSSFLIYLLPFVLLVGFFIWMSRRAQGQMGAVMNIGRSRAKVYATDKPKTTFADVAGYGPVKEEITEVVDFLKLPGKFKEIGARIPKGVLLVGPARHRQDAHRACGRR